MATGHEGRALELVERTLQAGRTVRLTVEGASMRPMLEQGDEVLVEPVAPEALCPGDLVAYGMDGRVVTHLLCFGLGRGPGRRFFLKGLANARGDWPIRQGRVLGRVTAAFRRGEARWIEPVRINPLSMAAWSYLLPAIARPRGLR